MPPGRLSTMQLIEMRKDNLVAQAQTCLRVRTCEHNLQIALQQAQGLKEEGANLDQEIYRAMDEDADELGGERPLGLYER